jgi:hypothetical protein
MGPGRAFRLWGVGGGARVAEEFSASLQWAIFWAKTALGTTRHDGQARSQCTSMPGLALCSVARGNSHPWIGSSCTALFRYRHFNVALQATSRVYGAQQSPLTNK